MRLSWWYLDHISPNACCKASSDSSTTAVSQLAGELYKHKEEFTCWRVQVLLWIVKSEDDMIDVNRAEGSGQSFED